MRIAQAGGWVLRLTAVFWLGCGGESEGPPGPRSPSAPPSSPLTLPVAQLPVASIEITPSSLVFEAIDATVQVNATAKDAGGKVISGIVFNWSSSKPEVVTIGANGIARARKVGEAKITATANGIAASVDAVVTQVVASITAAAGGRVGTADTGLIRPFIQLGIRSARVTPGESRTISSWVHDYMVEAVAEVAAGLTSYAVAPICRVSEYQINGLAGPGARSPEEDPCRSRGEEGRPPCGRSQGNRLPVELRR